MEPTKAALHQAHAVAQAAALGAKFGPNEQVLFSMAPKLMWHLQSSHMSSLLTCITAIDLHAGGLHAV